MTREILHARSGDTLDELVWRERGLGPADLPRLFALNPGIADLGAVLPTGTPVIVPAAAAPTTPVRDLIQLWS